MTTVGEGNTDISEVSESRESEIPWVNQSEIVPQECPQSATEIEQRSSITTTSTENHSASVRGMGQNLTIHRNSSQHSSASDSSLIPQRPPGYTLSYRPRGTHQLDLFGTIFISGTWQLGSFFQIFFIIFVQI